MSPDDPRHGTEAGHEQHQRDDEMPCQPCREAKLIAARRRSKRKQMGYTYTVPTEPARTRLVMWRDGGATYGEIADHTGLVESRIWELLNEEAPATVYTRTSNAIMRAPDWPTTALGVTRRIRALSRLGWPVPAIAEACGVCPDTITDVRRRQPKFISRKVREGILAGYLVLEMRLPPQRDRYQRYASTRTRNYAEKRGWPPPLAFDDIDNPHERPGSTEDRTPDPVVIDRILTGDYGLARSANRAERTEVVRRWRAAGRSTNELARLTGWEPRRYIHNNEEAA